MDNFILYVLFDIVEKYMVEHSEVIRKLCEIIWDVFFKPFIQESAKILANKIFKRDKEKSKNKDNKEQKSEDKKISWSLYTYKLLETEGKHNNSRKLEDDKKRVFMYIKRQIVKDRKKHNPNCVKTITIRVK